MKDRWQGEILNIDTRNAGGGLDCQTPEHDDEVEQNRIDSKVDYKLTRLIIHNKLIFMFYTKYI